MTTKSKIALVTGGSRGLGKDMVLSLAKKGLNVIFTYNNNKIEADKVVAEVLAMGQKAIAYQLDVSKLNTFDAFVSQINEHLQEHEGNPNFDYLINNAGFGAYEKITETTEATLDQMYAVHLKAPYLLSQKLFPFMNENGAIVNISSGLTRFAYDGYAPYASMKGALETLTKYMAKEFTSKKIRVNVLAPGAIETDFGGGAVRDNKDLNAMIANQTALGRVGVVDDIGSVVAFLCSDDAKWVNAQRLEVSGGIHI
ncbi:SDR family NAD(P)-dependent oxidoreductase [Flavobacterium eburneipallidum]|uniref:SDR family NAD(P)-dependent oxidoreductase n=1 Tax=Flavobacterium eburneipallidum TaxID=3003263 RepID=UPI0022AC0ED0|nr:SDR family oxidoreductase [Flavobacterium eburneipallidum]